uniref:MFS transporter n=1 Tax=Alistipes finegoldii TaxID=214856 RepID=UPI00248C9C74
MDNKEFTVSEVIDRIGISGHTWIMFVLLAFAMIFDGYDFMIVNSTNTYTGPTFLANVALGDAAIPVGGPGYSVQLGSLTTWGLLGMVLGGAIGGMISDRIGRKKMLVIAVLFYGVFTLPQAFAMNVPFFAAFRLIAGFGVGSCIPIVTTCFSECIPSKNRGVFVTFGMAFMVAGWVLAGLIAAPICSNPNPIIPGLCDPITYTTAADPNTPITIATNW